MSVSNVRMTAVMIAFRANELGAVGAEDEDLGGMMVNQLK